MASTRLPPRFFKVFISHFSSDSMMIPLSYNDELPRHLPKTAILQGSGGCVWKVAMEHKLDEVHFEQGWTKFVKDNSLMDGDFLTFVYNGDCVFEVSIYGLDGEKDTTRAVDAEVKDEKEDSVISISSEDTEIANRVPRSMSKGKAKVEVEEDSDDTEDDDYFPSNRDTRSNNTGRKQVESSDEDSDYIEAFGRLDVSDDFNSDTSDSPDNDGKAGSCSVLIKNKRGCSCSVQAQPKQKRDIVVTKIKNPEAYLDDPKNIYLETGLKKRKFELLVHAQLVKDYDLKFTDRVVYMDRYEKLVAKTVKWSDQRVCIKRWGSVCDRNKVKRKDRILCEFLRKGKLVYAVKVHIVRARFL